MIEALKAALTAATDTYTLRQADWGHAQAEVVEVETSIDKTNTMIAELTEKLQEATNAKQVLFALLQAANAKVSTHVEECKSAQRVVQELTTMVARLEPAPAPTTVVDTTLSTTSSV